ncbi:thioester reductase domain-containing protein [Amycolatopsis lurida]
MTGRDTDIAVVGIACRFPDAANPDLFWRNIDEGLVSTRELPDEVFRAAGVAEEVLRAPDFVRVAATLADVAEFAGDFFGYSPREAELMDPAQRLFLEACWEALESAGHPPRRDGPLTGVFAGTGPSTYQLAIQVARARIHGVAAVGDDADVALGGMADFLTARVAYKLGLRGPSVTVQTACSSGLTAVHYAVLSLLSGECDLALAGGATVNEPLAGYRHKPGGLASQDGLCRAFDAGSTGTSFSSGVGVVALRRLADALADGDPVLAVVRGSAVGNDGAERSGFTAPSPGGVADVVAAALRVADVPAGDVRYVEAHGSATALGDQIELRGLTDAFRRGTAEAGYCGLGSVKANVGHCGPAAGIAGFIKAVHVVRTGKLPPQPLFERPRDPGVLAESPFVVSPEAGVCTDPGRHVLVNSMGLGGSIATAVLAPPPAPTRPVAEAAEQARLVLSARGRGELDALSRALADELDSGELPLADVAHTLRVGRHSFAERRVVTGSAAEVSRALRLPRPPAARTMRAAPRDALVVLPPEGSLPEEFLARLSAALRHPETVRGPYERADDRFVILVGHGDSGKGKHVLPVDVEAIDEAVCVAWLHGVEVDWETLAAGRGRRIALPTYPFRRRRYWALDDLPPVAAADAPAAVTPAAVEVSTEDDLEGGLLALWRELFGTDGIGLDDEFGSLGGTSLLSVRMALEIQQRYDVLVNVHRAGGSRATVRRLAGIIRGRLAIGQSGGEDLEQIADGDGRLVDADLQLPLGPIGASPTTGRDVLLTGATGFLGAFLLHELLKSDRERIYCLVRAADETEAWQRIRDAAARFELPEPDPERVRVVPGDLRNIGRICAGYGGGELSRRVGHVLHCGARVVFTEPYRVLRDDNVLPVLDLLRWMRAGGIGDFSFVSSVAATGVALGGDGRITESRQQPLDPRQGGYGVSKWVCERLLEQAEKDGMRVRVFRPGFILGSTATGACNTTDWIWHLLAGGLAVGAHPLDERTLPMAPVDLVAAAIAELCLSPGSAGRAYHLMHQSTLSPRQLFELLSDAGMPTTGTTIEQWQRTVAARALETGSGVLSSMALYDIEGHQDDASGMEAVAWRSWLDRRGLDSAPTGALLRRCLAHLAGRQPEFGELMAGEVMEAR